MEMTLPLHLSVSKCHLSDEQFFQICQHNKNYRFERNAQGDLMIMAPTGGETSNRNIELCYQLQGWNRRTKLGMAFDSSGGFILPNGAIRSPDAAWITLPRWESLTSKQRTRFLPLAPDLVVELLSPTDSVNHTEVKMREYINNGTRLGWLINRKAKQVTIYRQGQEEEIIIAPNWLEGEEVLPEFCLDLIPIW